MIAFDTDVLVQVLLGEPSFVERAREIPVDQQSVPIVVIEEVFRGRLNAIRSRSPGRVRSVSGARMSFSSALSATCGKFGLSRTRPKPTRGSTSGGGRGFACRSTICASRQSAWRIRPCSSHATVGISGGFRGSRSPFGSDRRTNSDTSVRELSMARSRSSFVAPQKTTAVRRAPSPGPERVARPPGMTGEIPAEIHRLSSPYLTHCQSMKPRPTATAVNPTGLCRSGVILNPYTFPFPFPSATSSG